MPNNKMVKKSFIVLLLIISGKLLAIVRDSLIAAKFGATYVTDIYNFALGLVYLLITISYGLTTTVIPINSEKIQNKDINKRNKFVSNVLNITLVFFTLITILMIVFCKYIILIFGHGFNKSPMIFTTAINITRIMLLSLIFVGLQSLMAGVLESHKQFYEPSAGAMVSNLVYIIYLIFFEKKYGIYGFGVAVVIGFFMQYIINVPRFRMLGYKYKFNVDFKDNDVRKMFKLMIPIVISTSVVQLSNFVNTAFATNLYTGAATVFNFSNRINTLAYEVFAIGISTIIFPYLSEFAVNNDKGEFKKTLSRGLCMVLIFMIPAAVAIAVLRVPLITVLYKRGAFTNHDVTLTANALLMFTPAMIAYGARDVLNKAFYAVKDTRTPMINSFYGVLINVVLNFILIKFMSVSGLTLATSISAIFTTIIMFYDLSKKLQRIPYKYIIKQIIKLSFSSIIMGIIIFILNKYSIVIFGNSIKGCVYSIFISFIVGCLVYLIMLYILKVEEMFTLLSVMKKKLIKR